MPGAYIRVRVDQWVRVRVRRRGRLMIVWLGLPSPRLLDGMHHGPPRLAWALRGWGELVALGWDKLVAMMVAMMVAIGWAPSKGASVRAHNL